MLAYHGKPAEKVAILKQLRSHAKADQLVKGVSWQNGKGCAVGCTLHTYDHALYEPRFGIPQMLARLEDTIFEGLPNEEAQQWPIKFMSVIKPGADLSLVGWKFLHWLLTDKKVNPGIDHPLVRDAVKQCADVLLLITKGQKLNQSAASATSATSAARSAERSAARSAASAAASAAWSAESAARSAESAESAGRSAESAAWSAESAGSAAWSAGSVARSAAYSAMANKLLALLKACHA